MARTGNCAPPPQPQTHRVGALYCWRQWLRIMMAPEAGPALTSSPSRSLSTAAMQGMEADPAALTLLVERTERDVRACLNTLQFLARRKQAGAGGGCRRRIETKVRGWAGHACVYVQHVMRLRHGHFNARGKGPVVWQ